MSGVICQSVKNVLAATAMVLATVGCSNRPPSAPIVYGPTMLRPNTEAWFSCVSVDAEDDDVSYQFSWGDGTCGEWSEWNPPGLEYSETHSYTDTGIFNVTCRARDEKHETGWTDSLTVRVYDYAPFVPHRPSGPDTVLVGDTVLFLGCGDHPLGERIALQFDWGDTLGEWSGLEAPRTWVKMSHVYWQGGVFAVRARARDSLEHITDWSKPETVLVVDSFGPTALPAATGK